MFEDIEKYDDQQLDDLAQKIIEIKTAREQKEKALAELEEYKAQVRAKILDLAARTGIYTNEVWRKIVTTEFVDWAMSGAASENLPDEYIPSKPYAAGEFMVYRGRVYKSVEDNNTFSPAAYPGGWEYIKKIGAKNG